MEASRIRRETQTLRHPNNSNFGRPAVVPEAGSRRPRDMDFVARRPFEPARSLPAPVSTRLAPKLPPIDMNLPGQDSQYQHNMAIRHSRWHRIRKNATRAVAVSLVLLITVGGLLFSQGYWKLHKVFKGGTETAAALKSNVDPNLLKGEGDGRINVLLLGRGGGTHDAPDLTDTMMLASIDPVNHTATLLSLPRDLWVKGPNGKGAMKINTAWETGEFNYLGKVAPGSTDPKAIQAGFNAVDQTVESVLDVPVHYNLLVNFAGFQQAIDTVNGVTVTVPSDLVDPTMAWENHGNSVLAKAGIQQFGGAQALRYVRSRETSSDFARAQRQRAVMMALKTKVDTLGTLSNPLKISGLLNAFGNNAQTDLSMSDASRLYGIVKSIGQAKINSIGLADAPNNFVTTGNVGGQSVVLPKAGLFNFSDIQTYVRGQLKDGYLMKENAKVLVLNGTAQAGLADTTAAQLKSYGYNVIGVGGAPAQQNTTTLIDLSHGFDKYTKHYLEQRFQVKASSSLPDATMPTNGADFVIIVSNHEANPS